MPRSGVQLGCLTALLLFVLLGVLAEYAGNHDRPGDEEGGGPIAALGLVGLVLLFVLFAVIEAIRIVTARVKSKAIDSPASEGDSTKT